MHADRLVRRLEELTEAQIRFLSAIVRVPSDNPPGDCAPHAAATASLLEELGLEVERHPVPAELVRRHGMRSVTNLIVRHRFGDGPTVALNAHGDVVPPGAGWSHDPYGATVVDARLYGRGAAVSKSDFATYVFALLALKDSATAGAGTVELHLTYDEEAGGELGPRWLLEQGLSRPDLAVAAGLSYSVVTAHNGCLHLEIEIRGKSAHAAKPETGEDALEAATDVLGALYRERAGYKSIRSAFDGIDSPTLVVGLIEGGINTNVVPDRVVLRLDRRLIPEESGTTVETALARLVREAVAGRPGIQCDIRRIMLAEPLTPTLRSEALAAVFCRYATEVFGEPIGKAAVPLYTDARHYSAQEIPIVLYGAGPRTFVEAGAHGADEHVSLEDLRRATRVVALALAELLEIG